MPNWPFTRKSDKAESQQILVGLLANQVGQLPSLLLEVHENHRRDYPQGTPVLADDRRSAMWKEVGCFYLFLAGAFLLRERKEEAFKTIRDHFYALLQTEGFPLGDRYVKLPKASAQQLREFNDLFRIRLVEYESLMVASASTAMDPRNPLITRLAENWFGPDATGGAARLMLQGELNSLVLPSLKVVHEHCLNA